jgi:hypothetical protein
MTTAQSSVRRMPDDREFRLMDDDPAAVAYEFSGYYDPDSAAYDETLAFPTTSSSEMTDEGLPSGSS